MCCSLTTEEQEKRAPGGAMSGVGVRFRANSSHPSGRGPRAAVAVGTRGLARCVVSVPGSRTARTRMVPKGTKTERSEKAQKEGGPAGRLLAVCWPPVGRAPGTEDRTVESVQAIEITGDRTVRRGATRPPRTIPDARSAHVSTLRRGAFEAGVPAYAARSVMYVISVAAPSLIGGPQKPVPLLTYIWDRPTRNSPATRFSAR